MQNKQLSKDFHLIEFVRSQTAYRKGIDNTPDQAIIDDIQILVDNVLQPLRDKLGKPVIINSGYRCPALNKAIGGATHSQHMQGQAADIHVAGMTTKELADYVAENFDYDQLILEFYNPAEPTSGWTHVSFHKDNNRHEKLTALYVDGKTSYRYGFVSS